jgi:hypothetical protein
MNKITIEYRYRNETFTLLKEANNLRLFTTKENNVTLIVDKNDNVLFEIQSECNHSESWLELIEN